jgi:hypothetical protein
MVQEYKIVKLNSGGVVFGESKGMIDDVCCIDKPFSYYMTSDGANTTMAPYDSTVIQGEMDKITILKDNIVYVADFKTSCPEAFELYKKMTCTILVPDNSIIM